MNEMQFDKWLQDVRKQPLVMGIVNITPDSFSDGGLFFDKEHAIQHALGLHKDGAHIIDIGGESSRPGAKPISTEEEKMRVLPVINGIRKMSDVLISIDTMKPEVARSALDAGANIINDISGFRNSGMVQVATEYQVPVVVMHMQGDPLIMQDNPVYHNILEEINHYLTRQVNTLVAEGCLRHNIIIDPGIGFGKSVEDNFTIIAHLEKFKTLGRTLLVGPSRKSFIGKTLMLPVEDRVEGTSAAVTASVINGADIVRVHDVKEMSRVVKIAQKFRIAGNE